MAVSVVYGDITIPAGIAVAGSTWFPSPVTLTTSPIVATASGGSARVSVRLTGLSGNPRVDDVFIDPWNRGLTAADPEQLNGRSGLMPFDSYETRSDESLLQLGRQRHVDGDDPRRLRIVEASAAAVFIAVAVALAVFGSSARSLSVAALVVSVVAYLARAAGAVSRRERVDRSHAARVRADAVRASHAAGGP